MQARYVVQSLVYENPKDIGNRQGGRSGQSEKEKGEKPPRLIGPCQPDHRGQGAHRGLWLKRSRRIFFSGRGGRSRGRVCGHKDLTRQRKRGAREEKKGIGPQ